MEGLHRINDRRAHHAAERLIRKLRELRRAKSRVELVLHLREIFAGKLRVNHERMQRRRRIARDVAASHAEEIVRRVARPSAAPQDRIEVVADKVRTRVGHAEVEIVVIAIAVGDIRLRVIRDGVHRHEAIPLHRVACRLDRRHVVARVSRRVGRRHRRSFCQRLRQPDEVRPVVLTVVVLLKVIHAIRSRARRRRRLARALVAQVRAAAIVGAESAVGIARAIKREVVRREVRVHHFVRHIEAVRRRTRARQIHRIDAQLHRPRLRHRQPRFAENRAAQKLIRRVLRIEVERRDALPRIAVAKAHIETLRRNRPAAVAAIASTREIHHGVARAVMREPRRVELRVAVSLVVRLARIKRKRRRARVRADVGKLRLIHRPHHHPIKRHRPRVNRVIHLVETVLSLHECRRVIPRWRGPSAREPAIARGEIELHNRPVRFR